MKNKLFTLILIVLCLIASIFTTIITNDNAVKGIKRMIYGETFRTALYEDGYLLIEESSLDFKTNEKNHGKVMKEYPSFKESFDLYNVSSNLDDYPCWYKERKQIKAVIVESEIRPISLNKWFQECFDLQYCDLSKIDTSNVISTNNMFNETGSNVKTFKIKGMDSWDTSNIQDMAWMFKGVGMYSDTVDLGDLSKWDTSSVQSMYYMFYMSGQHAKSWNIGDISNWNVSNVNNFGYMFSYTAENVESWDMGDLTNWDIDYASVENMFMNGYEFNGYKHVPKYYSNYILGL